MRYLLGCNMYEYPETVKNISRSGSTSILSEGHEEVLSYKKKI